MVRVLTLLLMRHAKSDWDEVNETDHARTLTKRGWAEALEMGLLLKQKELIPAHILGSTAARARETAETVAGQVAYRGDLCFYDDLYESSPYTYIHRLRVLNDAWTMALLVAHNPEIQEFVRTVTARDVEMKTANIAQVQFDAASWSALAAEPRGTLVALWKPKP